MIESYYQDYVSLGLSVIPIQWDIEKKQPVSHREWSDEHKLLLRYNDNALMIKTCDDFACLDFDLKNTTRATIFDEWKTIILAQRPEIYTKLFVEKTRNAGYHVWLKYSALEKKLSLADSDKGSEVIALYAKGPLVYTFPTPGYTEISGSMQDISELNRDEFEFLLTTAQIFNEYTPTYDPNKKAIAYPAGCELFLQQFDRLLPDDAWCTMLDQIGLQKIIDYRYHKKDKFIAFKRSESLSDAISAKVYFKTKRVLIFSASLHDYPNWHNKHDYPVWSLPPSFVLFYKNGRSWEAAIEEIKGIIESIGLDIEFEAKIQTDFPLHVFPDDIRRSIIDVSNARSLPVEFVASAGIWTVSSLAGTRYISDFNGDSKNIIFCIMIAPVSVGKTPAFKVMCETPLKSAQESLDREYEKDIADWNEKKAKAINGKKVFTDKRPSRYIPIAVDGTTEGYLHKSQSQPNGIGVYQDEAETILNAGSFKSNNDAISFFTQGFSGGRVSQVRADETKERVVPNLNLNLLMGTQPDRLKNIFTQDRLASGFASRFLMVESGYKTLNVEADPFGDKKEMCEKWSFIVNLLFNYGKYFNAGKIGQLKIQMSSEAKDVYRTYYRRLLSDANDRILSRVENYVMGAEAKMSAYFPRLTQIIAIIHSPEEPIITVQIVHLGWELYRYYAESTIKTIANLHGELETGLPADLELLYQALPEEFTTKDAVDICTKLNMNPRRFEFSVRRKDFGKLVIKAGHGKYKKV